jgi:hypothetical protein
MEDAACENPRLSVWPKCCKAEGTYHDWRLQLVLQYRIQVTRTWGGIRVMSPMQPR